MIEKSVNIKYKDDPVLLDRIIQDMQKSLMDSLPWLNYAFGRSYKMVEHRTDGNKFVYPAAYNGNAEYVSLLPNDNFGNFSWFDIYDPQEIVSVVQGLPWFTFEGAIVFWYNLESIYDDATVLHTEEIKDEIIRLLTSPGLVSGYGRIEVSKIYERFENIYKGYSIEGVYNNNLYKGEGIQSIDKQFFLYPYAGLRIEFSLKTRELCYKK